LGGTSRKSEATWARPPVDVIFKYESNFYTFSKKEVMFSIAHNLQGLPEDKRNRATHRIRQIHAAQQRIGMTPRDDSLLTFKYAVEELDDDNDVPSSIANELFIVDMLYKETSYGRILEPALREIAAYVKKKYNIPWGDVWDMVRFFGPTMLKLYCAKTNSDKIFT